MDGKCAWGKDTDGFWITGCGGMHVFIDGDPDENRYKFCPYCGRPLVQSLHESEEQIVYVLETKDDGHHAYVDKDLFMKEFAYQLRKQLSPVAYIIDYSNHEPWHFDRRKG